MPVGPSSSRALKILKALWWPWSRWILACGATSSCADADDECEIREACLVYPKKIAQDRGTRQMLRAWFGQDLNFVVFLVALYILGRRGTRSRLNLLVIPIEWRKWITAAGSYLLGPSQQWVTYLDSWYAWRMGWASWLCGAFATKLISKLDFSVDVRVGFGMKQIRKIH